jgi:hypothetical protein
MSKAPLSRLQARIGFGAAILFFTIGVVSLWYGTYVVQKVKDAEQRWSRVEGVIVSSGLRRTGSSSHSQRSTAVVLDVRYEYSVGGASLASDKVGVWNFGGAGGGERKAEKVSERYKVGDSVEVLYDPDNPSDAMLDPSVISFWWLHAPHLFGLVFLVGGIFRILQYAPIAFGQESSTRK